MMREYELTDEEYRTVVDALEHAHENAVHSDAQAKFHTTWNTLMKQYESQEGYKPTEPER